MNMFLYLPIFEALGHETRLKVFDFIYQSGDAGARPKDLIERFGIDSGTLDFHLKKLLGVGLISLKIGSRRGVYCSSPKIPLELAQLLDATCAKHRMVMPNNVSLGSSKFESLH
jgi:ArsR family transcriptional regulator, arsenate/arsenite/antimonite-responsive transcriptional repressor